LIFDFKKNDNINKNNLAKAGDSVRFIYPPDKSGGNLTNDFKIINISIKDILNSQKSLKNYCSFVFFK